MMMTSRTNLRRAARVEPGVRRDAAFSFYDKST